MTIKQNGGVFGRNPTFNDVDVEGDLTVSGDVNIKDINIIGDVDVTGTVTADGLTVDTDTLYVDSSNHRVGIGTSSPSTTLDLVGNWVSNTGQLSIDTPFGETYSGLAILNNGAIKGFLYHDNSAGTLDLQTYTTDALLFKTNNTERMRIDSSGNVGIGVVPTTDHNPVVEALQIGTTANLFGRNDAEIATLTSNSYLSLAGYPKYITTNEASEYIQTSGNHIWYNAPSGTAGAACTQTERMRIDASGNVLLGSTTLVSPNPGHSFSVGNGSQQAIGHNDSSSGTYYSYYSYNGSVIGSITQSGTTSVAYNTSSDYRLKTDAQPMIGASERVQALKPINFAWKVDGSRVDGFLAHEAQSVVPECATGTKDAMRDEEYEVTPAVYEDIITPAIEAVAEVPAVYDADGVLVSEMVPAVEAQPERTEQRLVTEAVMGTRSVPDYQGIDQSKLVPLLTAALQEALTAITDLKARVTALEGAV